MFQRRSRRFRHHSNGKSNKLHGDVDMRARLRTNSFSNGQIRNNFKTTQSAEKLFAKYNALAKEALSSGDKTLSENYFQHADHFMRIIEGKNKTENQNKIQVIDKHLSEESGVNQEGTIEKKKE